MRICCIVGSTVLLVVVGCARDLPTNPPSVVGQYEMTGFDGSLNLPCCRYTDSTGTVVSVGGGAMDIGYNEPAGRFAWDLVRIYEPTTGASTQVQSRFSAGSYAWNGATWILSDSTGLSMTAVWQGGVLIIRRQGHDYEFWRLIDLPH